MEPGVGGWKRGQGFWLVVLIVLGLLALWLVARQAGAFKRVEPPVIARIRGAVEEQLLTHRSGSLRALACGGAIPATAAGLTPPDNPTVLSELGAARRLLGAEIVFVLAPSGRVVACTPYDGDKTLTGNNYGFRPYFRSAMAGRDAIYPAVGVTTGQRGIYFSTPIPNEFNRPGGTLVVKVGLGAIDALLNAHSDPLFLLSPEGVIFATNRPEHLYRCLPTLAPEERRRLTAARQFGDRELVPFPLPVDHDSTLRLAGIEGRILRRPVLGDWTLLAYSGDSGGIEVDRQALAAVMITFFVMAAVIAGLALVIRARNRTEAALRATEAGLVEDIRARKAVEAELNAYRDHLEELVENRTQQLRQAKELAEHAMLAKSRFLASMSHELRTPLNAILGYSSLLTQASIGPDAAANLERIRAAGGHLLELVNHLLAIGRNGLENQEGAPLPEMVPVQPPPPEEGLKARIATLDPGWIREFDRCLVLGDGEEAALWLEKLVDSELVKALGVMLKEFRFEEMREWLGEGHD